MFRSTEVVTRALTVSRALPPWSKSVIPPLRTDTAVSRPSGGKGLTNLSYWGGSTHLWPEWETLKALADSPLKHPLFYNPLLLSLSLCMVLKEPVKAPPPAKAVVKCWWNPAQQPLAHLFSFNFLSRGMRGQKEQQLSGFSPLFNPSLPNLFVFPSVYLCSLSQETQLFIWPSAWKLSQDPSSWAWWGDASIGDNSKRFGLRKI